MIPRASSSFDPKGFFASAQALRNEAVQDTVNDEAHLRSAISRAYIGVLCAARDFLRDKMGSAFPPNSANVTAIRNQLLSAYFSTRDFQYKELAGRLSSLQQGREGADFSAASDPLIWANDYKASQLAQDAMSLLKALHAQTP